MRFAGGDQLQIVIFNIRQRTGQPKWLILPFLLTNLKRIILFLQNITYQENFFLQRNDVTLLNIDRIYEIVDRKKNRLVSPYSKINPKLDGLQIVCKVWRNLPFLPIDRNQLFNGIVFAFDRIFVLWDLDSDVVSLAKANELLKLYPHLPFPISMICCLLISTSEYQS